MDLPNPPLADHEVNDRRVYAQCIDSDALLVTSDIDLVGAVRAQHPLNICTAVTPVELVALGKFARLLGS